MTYRLSMLRPLGDDDVPTHGVMPSKMKAIDDMEDLQDHAYSDCAKGVLLGVVIGALLWLIPLVLFVVLRG